MPRASAALPPAIEPMQLELERDALRVRRLLRGPDEIRYPTPPAYSEALCVEARAGRHRDLLGLDSAVFIPLYLMLGLCALAWYYFLALRARGADWARRGRVPLALIAWLLASAALLAVAAWRDAAENKAAQAVLDYALGGAPITGSAPDWRRDGRHDARCIGLQVVGAGRMGRHAGRAGRLAPPSLSLCRAAVSGADAGAPAWPGLCWPVHWLPPWRSARAVLAWGASAEAARHSATQLLDIGFGAVLCHAVLLFVFAPPSLASPNGLAGVWLSRRAQVTRPEPRHRQGRSRRHQQGAEGGEQRADLGLLFSTTRRVERPRRPSSGLRRCRRRSSRRVIWATVLSASSSSRTRIDQPSKPMVSPLVPMPTV